MKTILLILCLAATFVYGQNVVLLTSAEYQQLKQTGMINPSLHYSLTDFSASSGIKYNGSSQKNAVCDCFVPLDSTFTLAMLPNDDGSSALINFRLHNIGFVFQSYNLIPVLTARENVEFIMQLQNLPEELRDKRVEKLFREIGLEDKMNERPSRLSGGQQQRVAVARALASKPQFVLADEPTANLDSKSAANLLDIMDRLNREENITFLFSTHDQRVIERARRVITLVDGKIASDTAAVRTDEQHPSLPG